MKLVLDTTYLLPVVGISVKEIPNQDILGSLNKIDEIALSQITIFEITAKAAKFVAAGKLDAQRVSRGIQGIINDDSVEKLDPYTSESLAIAIKLREMLGDFIDCMILGTALSQAGGLMTEDGSIHELKRNAAFKELVKSVNPEFEIRRL